MRFVFVFLDDGVYMKHRAFYMYNATFDSSTLVSGDRDVGAPQKVKS